MSDDTIFDKILRGEIPAEVVYQDDDVFAFKDINPAAPIHVQVIPRKKVARFAELRRAEPTAVAAYIQGIARVAEHLGLEPDGYRVVFNNGANALQSVEYLHAHILGGRRMGWTPA